MNNETWLKAWAELGSYFQRPDESVEISKTRSSLYRDHLDVLNDSQFRQAVRECIDTLPRDRFPSIAQIRECSGIAPEAVRQARTGDFHRASPEFRKAYVERYKLPIVSIDEQDLRHGLAAEDLWLRTQTPSLAHVEAVARDYPIVEGLHVLAQMERIAVLAGLMKPIRLAAWSLAEIKAGKRVAIMAPIQHPPITINLPQYAPETFMETAAAERVEKRIREQDAAAFAPAIQPALAPAPRTPQPAMTPAEDEEFF